MSTEMDIDMADSASVPISNVQDNAENSEKPSVIVTKPIPYTFDLGNLAVFDSNPLPDASNPSNADIAAASRDCAQALINQLLTTCPIGKAGGDDGDLVITLPEPTTLLPREKHLPTPRAETKWEKFARKKGIKAKRNDERSKMVYDEEKGDWVPKWGYKGKNKDLENQWLVEVDEKKEAEAEAKGATIRSMNRMERKEAVKRNERKQRANDRRSKKYGA